MLQRFTQVGEFYVIDPTIVDSSGEAAIMIYDEECDKFVKITHAAAEIAAGLIPKAAGGVGTEPLLFNPETGTDEKYVSGVDLIVVARPFMEHAMLSAVLAVSGSDTGATCFGPSDMQLSVCSPTSSFHSRYAFCRFSCVVLTHCRFVRVCVLQANTSVKTIEGHYTGHFKAIVAKPQNVKVLRDVMANGYRAGGNAKFFDKDGNLQKAKQAIMERLSFEDGSGDGSDYPASLLAFPMKRAQYEGGACQTVMSLTSRLLPWEVQSADHKSFPGGEVAFQAYNKAMSLNQVHFGEDLRASENQVSFYTIPLICFYTVLT